ncbi:MAG: bifunctional folylpolyglutamate synthase/dihydrofolate synthase [Opitutae bacterium]|nr:bifunctional folylpolyglutamate synthase/dihydrofolate synthase [Opitutae bacterium]
MHRLVEALGHPERRYPVVHLAGTNGKGSVSAMLESILRTAGSRTGLYTSPHLVKLGERVQVDRHILSEAEIVAYTHELRPVAQKLAAAGPDEHPTFFEFMTAMAFLQFARREVDVAVIEVGLGGRLDGTNVVQPEVTVITSIGLDHMEQLGDNVAKIAHEKAGIIKDGRPVVLGRLPAEAEQVIREVARAHHAPIHSVREVFGENLADYPETNLEGDYQRWNAATATLAARLLRSRFKLDDATITRGLRQVSWPGRWQRTSIGGRPLILDASHNPEGAQVLENNLHKLVASTGRKPVIVTGVLGEFRARALLDVVCRYAKEVHLVPPHQERACTYEQLETIVPEEHRALLRRATLEQVFPDAHHCSVGGPDDTVVVTGSIYLLGEVLTRIEPDRGSGEGRLQDF